LHFAASKQFLLNRSSLRGVPSHQETKKLVPKGAAQISKALRENLRKKSAIFCQSICEEGSFASIFIYFFNLDKPNTNLTDNLKLSGYS